MKETLSVILVQVSLSHHKIFFLRRFVFKGATYGRVPILLFLINAKEQNLHHNSCNDFIISEVLEKM